METWLLTLIIILSVLVGGVLLWYFVLWINLTIIKQRFDKTNTFILREGLFPSNTKSNTKQEGARRTKLKRRTAAGSEDARRQQLRGELRKTAREGSSRARQLLTNGYTVDYLGLD